MEHHVSGEGLQLLGGHIWQLQPLQVKHILLVVGHLWEHGLGLQRLLCVVLAFLNAQGHVGCDPGRAQGPLYTSFPHQEQQFTPQT